MPIELPENVHSKRGRPPVHDWDMILDGTPRRYVWGVDFESRPSSFQTAAYAQARARGLRVATYRNGDNIDLQAFHPGEGPNQ